jgi:hypothetical protein
MLQWRKHRWLASLKASYLASARAMPGYQQRSLQRKWHESYM